MIEVLADGGTPFLAHLFDFRPKPGIVLVVHVPGMTPQNRAHRTTVAIPSGYGRKTIVFRKANRNIVDKEVEATRGHIVPVLRAGLPARLGNNLLHARAKRIVVETGLWIGKIRAPFPFKVGRLVVDLRRTLLCARCVLLSTFPCRHTFVGYLNPRRKHRRNY